MPGKAKKKGAAGGAGARTYQKLATKVGPLRKEDVTCPICWSVFIEPVSLPCDHALCSACFKTHLNETSLQCPCCRRRFATWSRNALKHNNYVDTVLWERIKREFPTLVETRLLGGDSQALDPAEFVSVLEPTRKRKRDATTTDENDQSAVYVNRLDSETEEEEVMPQLTLQVGVPVVIGERENDETPDSIDLEVNRHFRPIRPEPKTPPKKRPDGSFMPEPVIIVATPVKGLALSVDVEAPVENSNALVSSSVDEGPDEELPIRFVPLRALQNNSQHEEDEDDISAIRLDAEPGNNQGVDDNDDDEGFTLFEESPSKRQKEEPVNPGGSQSLIDQQHSQDMMEEEVPAPPIPDSQQSADLDLNFFAEQEKAWMAIKQKCIQEWEDRRIAAKLQKDWNKKDVESRGAGAKDPYSLRNWLVKKEATTDDESTPSSSGRSMASSTVTSASSNEPRRSKRNVKSEK